MAIATCSGLAISARYSRCRAGDTQEWHISRDTNVPAPFFRIHRDFGPGVKNVDLVLDVPGSSKNPRVQVIQFGPQAGPGNKPDDNQLWGLIAVTYNGTPGYWAIQNKNSQQVLTVQGGDRPGFTAQNGTPVVQDFRRAPDSPHQLWILPTGFPS